MVNGECSPYNYKLSKINITAIIKNPQTLRFLSNYLKTKRRCNHAVQENRIYS